jgi:hypothetical protein
MQTQTGEHRAASAPSEGTAASPAFTGAIPPIPGEAARRAEEMRMLLLGFGTGLSIAFIFLIYVVFAYAHWLP